MERISVDQLPAYSEWPARLLDPEASFDDDYGGTGTEWYDRAYESLLAHANERSIDDFRALMRSSRHRALDEPVPISQREECYLVDVDELLDLQEEVTVEAFDGVLDGGDTVVSLGCGWGHNLGVLAEAYPNCTFIGGEKAPNGVALCRQLFEDHDRVRVEPFDFFDDEWPLLSAI